MSFQAELPQKESSALMCKSNEGTSVPDCKQAALQPSNPCIQNIEKNVALQSGV